MRVLMIEDELKLSKAVKYLLKEQKIDCETVANGRVGIELALANSYDVIILDVMLPELDGYQILSTLRENNCDTPIIMLTAKNQIEDKVRGLNLGSDDYLTKPFDSNELVARIRALSRRNGTKLTTNCISFADLTLDLAQSELKSDSESIVLNFKELEIMKLLMTQSQQIVPKELIFDKVWGWDSNATDSSIEAYMSFLRKKLKFLNSAVSIKNYTKIGYKLENTNDKKS